MAYTSGTAANYLDLLAKLRTFALANGWEELEWTDSIRLWLKGTGTAGEDEIYVGIEAYENTPSDYFNWRLMGAWGYRAGRTFSQHPMSSGAGSAVACFWQYPMAYWMVATGRRLIVAAKVSTVYMLAHLGLLNPPATRYQYPYPLLVAGAGITEATRWSSTALSLFASASTSTACGRIALPGGRWKTHNANGQIATTSFCRALAASIHSGVDGSYLLEQLVVVDQAEKSILGELDGLFAVSGHNNSAENIISAGGKNYLVIPDVYRAGISDYCALRLD